MLQTRISTPADIPRQRELWQLAFGDDGAYVDNFYHTYYKPERMLMLEEDGVVQAMTAWFDTTFAVPGRGEYRAAYLYAVATHPEARGRGLAGRLLSDADGFFRSWGIPAVTTKPAEPSLHQFFGRNGFRECFVHGQNFFHWEKADRNPGAVKSLERLSPGEYTALRESWLAETPHIAIPEEMMGYQAGACALTPGGGLYALAAPHGRAALCAEGMENGKLLVKELLCAPEDRNWVLECLPSLLPHWCMTYRVPEGSQPFAMLKWLDPEVEAAWDWSDTAYLGLAFD